MKRALGIFFSGIILLVGLAAMIFKPVPILPENELAVVTGEVSSIYATDSYDIFFKLQDGDRFYINRGTEQGYDVDELRNQLLGKTITIKYPEAKSLLGGNSHHLSKLEFKGKTLYSEVN